MFVWESSKNLVAPPSKNPVSSSLSTKGMHIHHDNHSSFPAYAIHNSPCHCFAVRCLNHLTELCQCLTRKLIINIQICGNRRDYQGKHGGKWIRNQEQLDALKAFGDGPLVYLNLHVGLQHRMHSYIHDIGKQPSVFLCSLHLEILYGIEKNILLSQDLDV